MNRRPTNLNLFSIYFPVTAWVSIAHRLSGIVVFLMIPGLLWILQESLASKAHFQNLGTFFCHPIALVGLWLFLAALLYHWIAGLRHLLMDMHIGESKIGGRTSAWLIVCVFFGFIVFLGYKLW